MLSSKPSPSCKNHGANTNCYQQEFDKAVVAVPTNEPTKAAKPEATATSIGKSTEESKTGSENSEKIVDEEEQGYNGFVILFFIFVVVAVSAAAFIKFGGVTWVSRTLRRGRGPKYHRVDQDLEK